jgi:hypothetical protein
MRHAVAILTAAGVLMAVVLGTRLAVLRTKEAQTTVHFCGYTDYWMVDPPTGASISSILHFPREARFTVQNHTVRSVVSIWPGSRLQFRGTAANIQVIPQMQATLGPTAVIPMSVALKGAEHGEWRVLMPVSNLRFEIWVEKIIGEGSDVRFRERPPSSSSEVDRQRVDPRTTPQNIASAILRSRQWMGVRFRSSPNSSSTNSSKAQHHCARGVLIHETQNEPPHP